MATKKKTKKSTGKTLVIVESPNKIKKISSYLGPDYIIRASFGHIIDLSTGDKRFNLGVDIENDFKPKYRIMPDKKDKIQSIIDAASGVDSILLATDDDREGEAIAWHLHSCLESAGKPISRIKFNAITKSALTKAIKNQGPLNKEMFDAQQARRVVDRIVGFMSSNFLRDSVGPNLSAGRVQSVAAKLIVDREKEINAFTPEEYWVINSNLSDGNESFSAKYINKVTDGSTAKDIKSDLESDSFTVSNVESKQEVKKPLPPLTTSTLQQSASTRFGYKVSATMKCAQSLYETGLITYMRTDSTRIAPEAVKEARDYIVANNMSVPKSPNSYSTKTAAQDAHEAIRPTDIKKLPQNVFLSDDQQKVYTLIWERFVASQMEPALFDTMNVDIRSSSGHALRASGKALKKEGWLEIATDHKKKASKGTMLPNVSVGDSLSQSKTDATQKFTQPPSRFNEATLVRELEKRGIGRPSTYASITETIKNRNYVEIQGKSYHATEVGVKVIDKLTDNFTFMNYTYTADMEDNLDKIADGKLTYVSMLDSFFDPFQKECKKAQFDGIKDYGIMCPTCGSKTILKHGRYGFYMCCIDYPNCKGSVSVDVVDDKPIVKERFKKDIEFGVTCPECNKGMYKVDGKFGPFYTCEDYPKCKGKRKVPYGKSCPDCKNELFVTILDGTKKLACMGYPNCRYIEDLPKNAKNDWINPKNLETPKSRKSVDKVLKSSRGKKK